LRGSVVSVAVILAAKERGGIELGETARRRPATDIMVITIFGDEDHVLASIEAGATGYILKDSLPAEFVELIKQLRAGGSPISPVIARQLLKRLKPGGTATLAAEETPLSARETEVLAFGHKVTLSRPQQRVIHRRAN
jgi:DNA-binding NarL/FixJ family response regulator